ncbi:MAG: hypothetical protein DCC75_03955 [Proteobacteria bacterium]|nr:MAG: hypothetical protein DCC75_03955 [Pseudomonadota bacterium]
MRILADVLTDVTIREGSQQPIDLRNAAVPDKLRILSGILASGVKHIELTAFAPGEWFADAHELASSAQALAGSETDLRALYFNARGLDDLRTHPNITAQGVFHTAATSKYRSENYRQTSKVQVLEKLRSMLQAFNKHKLAFDNLVISTAFGEHGEPVAKQQLIDFIAAILSEAKEGGFDLRAVTLADTVGNADPEELLKVFSAVKQTWPDKVLRAHLHPPKATAQACVEAALQGGADEWEAAWGGVGGSPFAEKPGGNLDIRLLIKIWLSKGWKTGLDQSKADALIGELRTICSREISPNY